MVEAKVVTLEQFVENPKKFCHSYICKQSFRGTLMLSLGIFASRMQL